MFKSDPRFARWIIVQAYKHDGSLHRQWSPAYLVREDENYFVLAFVDSAITEGNGRKWMTRERSIFVLSKKKWMNVIAMFKKGQGLCYYVNIASPSIYDQGYIKYIDYDLDVKLFPDKTIKLLDEREYASHIQTYAYKEDLTRAIETSLKDVEKMIENHEFPFIDEEIEALYEKFLTENTPRKI